MATTICDLFTFQHLHTLFMKIINNSGTALVGLEARPAAAIVNSLVRVLGCH